MDNRNKIATPNNRILRITYLYNLSAKYMTIVIFFIFIFTFNNQSWGKDKLPNDKKQKTENALQENGIVVFGKYEQDGNIENGPEPIEWIVLNIKEDKILLISKYILDYKSMHSIDGEYQWKETELREWLNEEFFQKAFSYTEKLRMIRIELSSKSLSNRIFPLNNNSSMSENPFLYKLLGAKDYTPPEGIFDFVVCPDLADINILKKMNKKEAKAVPAIALSNTTRYYTTSYRLNLNQTEEKYNKPRFLPNRQMDFRTEMNLNEINNTKEKYAPMGYWLRNWSSSTKYSTYYQYIDKKGSESTMDAKIKNGVRPVIIIKTKIPNNPWKKE